MLTDRAKPAARRPRKTADKPPMPEIMKAYAAKAIARHQRRLLSPCVAVEVAKAGEPFIVASPHDDSAAWEAMICDALGTRSVITAQTFLYQLKELCSQHWHPSEVEGEYGQWCPDEGELNMVLNMIASIKPRNELEAAQAAQMVAVHLMTMRVAGQALSGGVVASQDAAIAGKLARTFVMQAEGLAKLRGRRPATRQTITVRQEKHVHTHQHVHVEGGAPGIRSQPHEATEPGSGGHGAHAPMLGQDASGNILSLCGDEGSNAMPKARRGTRLGRTDG